MLSGVIADSWIENTIVKVADPETIKAVSGYQAEDSVNIYKNGLFHKKLTPTETSDPIN